MRANLFVPIIVILTWYVCFRLAVSQKLLLSRKSQNISDDRDKKADLDTLLLAQVLFRHGDRTPLTDYKTNIHKDYLKIYGVKGLGQLTPIGSKQCHKLGLYLRQRYDGYLNRDYSFDQLYAQSSDVDRTIMSTLSVLQGLFPTEPGDSDNCPKSWQPIPVHVLTKSTDNKIAFNKNNCEKYKRLYAELLKNPGMVDYDRDYDFLYRYLKKWTGENVTSFEDVYHIYDTLLINDMYNLPLPDWSEDGIFREMFYPASVIFEFYTNTEEMKRLYVGPFLEEIITYMDIRSGNFVGEVDEENFPKAQLYLYGGHDTTISSVINVLGVYDDFPPPPYTSALIFELHKLGKTVSGSGVEVKLFFRYDQSDATFPLNLTKCGTPCTLENFKATYSKYWKTSIGWAAECDEGECKCKEKTKTKDLIDESGT